MLVGVEERVASLEVEDCIITKKVIVGFYDTILNITFSEEVLTLLSRPWKKVLVAKFLGKFVGYQMFCKRVCMM